MPAFEGLLGEFLRLADADGERIARYVRRWGMLELCEEHDLPTSHKPGRCFYRPAEGDAQGWEPLEAWRAIARLAGALCRIAIRLRDGKRGDAADWRIVYERSGREAVVNQFEAATSSNSPSARTSPPRLR